MIKDGVTAKEADNVKTRDIAELLLDSLGPRDSADDAAPEVASTAPDTTPR